MAACIWARNCTSMSAAGWVIRVVCVMAIFRVRDACVEFRKLRAIRSKHSRPAYTAFGPCRFGSRTKVTALTVRLTASQTVKIVVAILRAIATADNRWMPDKSECTWQRQMGSRFLYYNYYANIYFRISMFYILRHFCGCSNTLTGNGHDMFK